MFIQSSSVSSHGPALPSGSYSVMVEEGDKEDGYWRFYRGARSPYCSSGSHSVIEGLDDENGYCMFIQSSFQYLLQL